VLHCFSGDGALAAEATRRGYFLSFAGNLTYPNTPNLREAAAAAGEDRLLIETDSPFLAPQSERGRPNHPANVLAVAQALAEIRDVNLDRMVARTAASALEAFPLLR
jgi:TatD DNase family protein